MRGLRNLTVMLVALVWIGSAPAMESHNHQDTAFADNDDIDLPTLPAGANASSEAVETLPPSRREAQLAARHDAADGLVLSLTPLPPATREHARAVSEPAAIASGGGVGRTSRWQVMAW